VMDRSRILRTPQRRGGRARYWFLALGLALAALAAGCKEGGPGAAVYTKHEGGGAPLRLAVLPFSSPANAPEAGQVVTSTVITYLLSTGKVDVVEPGQVEKAMRAARYAPETAAGLDPEMLGTLQQQLRVDAYMVGSVEEYGEVRVGPDSYPSVSFSARLIRASDDAIIWAASISRTGADRVKVFDIGRVSSLGKLTKSAVAEMAASLSRSAPSFASAAPVAQPAVIVQPESPAPAASSAFQDESRTYGVADLKALLPEVTGFGRGEVSHSRHFHDTVSCLYSTATLRSSDTALLKLPSAEQRAPSLRSTSDGGAIDARLVDYQKTDVAAKAVRQESQGLADEKVGSFDGMSGPAPTHAAGVVKLNVILGRFGLYLTGPESAAARMRQLAISIASGK